MEKPADLDIDKLKEEAYTVLLEDSREFLDEEVANKRLDGLKNAKVLSSAQISEEVERVTGLKLPEDKAGGIIIFDGEDKLGRKALLEKVKSPVVAYHSAVHEGIHLLGPDSIGGKDMYDRKYVMKSLGPEWTYLYFDEHGKITDTERIPEEEKIFWEAATDFVAAEKTNKKFGREITDETLVDEGVGFPQRYWIEYLLKKHPNPEELLKTMKKALYQGKATEFLRVLGGRLDNPHVPFYNTLASYMLEGELALNEGRAEDYNTALDKWMEAVNYHFDNGGAYSLNMEHF